MKKKIITYSIVLILLTAIATIFIMNILAQRVTYAPRDPYDKLGFVDYENVNKSFFQFSNSKFEFKLDKETTQFEVLDKDTNQVWKSSAELINPTTPNEVQELYSVYYERKLETPKKISVLDESIKYNNYSFKEGTNTLDILYLVGGKHNITFTDLPRRVDKLKFEEKILEPLEELALTDFEIKMNLGFLKSRYLFIESDQIYSLRDIIAEDALNIIYDLVFNKSLYTQEDYMEDSIKFGLETEDPIPYFEFVVRYSLLETGLEVKIINESIKESEQFPIAYMDILPYFGVGNIGDEGFTVIPDGSGIYIDHNNGIYNAPVYDKRIYGADLSIGNAMEIMPEPQETIKLPMYGYSKNNYGYLNVVETSDAMSSIRASYNTTITGGNYTNKIPYAHYRFYLRERDAYNFTSSLATQRVYMWTKAYNTEDFTSKYIFLEDGSNHDKFAFEYQEYLMNKLNLDYMINPEFIHLSFLGGYIERKHFMGFGYDDILPLTTANQVKQIVDEYNINKSKLSVSYQGWSNDGLKPTTMNKINFNKKVVDHASIVRLLGGMEDDDISFYLEFLSQTGFTDRNIKVSRDTLYNIFQESIKYHDYNLATNLVDKTTRTQYYLSGNAQNNVNQKIKSFADSYQLNGIGIWDEGSRLGTQFKQNEITFRNEAINNFNTRMETLNNKSLLFRNPNYYAMIYADKIMDLPLSGTKHRMVDHEIPLVQLILNGLFNYYSSPINLNTGNSLEWHKLKAIETGSKIQFLLSYTDTIGLIKTEYSQYFSTHYIKWLENIEYLYDSLNDLDIYNNRIISHRVLNSDYTLVEVTYSNGKQYLINYLTETVIETEVII